MESPARVAPAPRWRVLLVWACLGVAGYGWICYNEPKAPHLPESYSRTPGVRLFYRYECGRCHTVEALPGCRGHLGPPLDRVGQVAAGRRSGMSARDYLRESLVQPRKFIVEGYLKSMPSYEHLPPQEIDELVTYLESLR